MSYSTWLRDNYRIQRQRPQKTTVKATLQTHVLAQASAIYDAIPSHCGENHLIIVRALGQTVPVKAKSLKAICRLLSGQTVKVMASEKEIVIYHSFDGTRFCGKTTLVHFFPNSPKWATDDGITL